MRFSPRIPPPQPPDAANLDAQTFLPRLWRVPFVAIDFEQDPLISDGAHAVGMVRVEQGRVVGRLVSAIRWPDGVHTWPVRARQYVMQRAAPTFAALWPQMRALMEGAEFLAAHNASYDRRVLRHACVAAGVVGPRLPFVCSLAVARATWPLRSHALNVVCEHLGIALNHHEPLSDAEACANVLLAARPPRRVVHWTRPATSALPQDVAAE